MSEIVARRHRRARSVIPQGPNGRSGTQSPAHRALRRLIPLAAAALAGCATPQPGLGHADAVLRDPSRQALADLAGRLRHPRLPPMALDFSKPLTPPELAVIAVVADPELKAARAKAAIAEAQVFSAGLLPDPVVNLSYARRLGGPDIYDGMAGSLVYELAALRERRTVLQGQRAAAEQARLDLAWQELQAAGQAELLAARIAGLGRVLAFNERARRMAEFALGRVLQAQARGDVRADEVESRRLAAADAATSARTTEVALEAARQGLDRLLGLSPDARLDIAPGAPAPALPPDAQALFEQARTERLDLQALRAGYESQSASVRKAMMDAFPSLQLSLGAGTDTAHTTTFDPAVNFTLPLWNRNRGGIAVAKATQAELRAEYGARLFSARAEIADLVAQLRIEGRQHAEVSAQLAPLQRIVSATGAAAARGDLARTAAETAGQSLADKELALAALEQSMAEQRVTLKLAVGGPLLD